MHYYKRNIGDYHKKAGRLTLLQHGVYTVLMDAIYDREKFPTKEEAIDWTWASTPEEIQAVEFVLRKFFTNGDGRYTQKRIEEEIESYTLFCEQQAEKGRKGGRPKANGLENKPNGLNNKPSESRNKAKQSLTTNHKPLTTNHSNITASDDAVVKTSSKSPPCPYQQIADLYHEKLPMLPKVVKLTDARKKAIRARWKGDADNLEFWSDYFEYVAKSKFLTGRVDPPPGRKQFLADIDFLIRESTIIKTQEGKYHG